MSSRKLTIGTRGSKLAFWQADWIAGQLERQGCETRISVIRTTGDRLTQESLRKLGAQEGIKGVFTKEIEDALLAGSIDLAVHSLKDLPVRLDPGLALGCIPQRADARDALLGKKLGQLKAGDCVGTSSQRRAIQLRSLLPGVVVQDLRGNIDTRIRKLHKGLFDAIVLAAAGLQRLQLEHEISEILEPEVMVPAIGQGALGVETRAGDQRVQAYLDQLHDSRTAAEVGAERALLRALGGGCQVPLGGHATMTCDKLTLVSVTVSGSGAILRSQATGALSEAEKLGESVAADLRQQGVNLLAGIA